MSWANSDAVHFNEIVASSAPRAAILGTRTNLCPDAAVIFSYPLLRLCVCTHVCELKLGCADVTYVRYEDPSPRFAAVRRDLIFFCCKIFQY